MAASNFRISMSIGAVVSSSFNTVFRGANKEFSKLGSTIDTFKSKQAAIKKVQLGETNVAKARIEYQKAAREVSRLKKEISKTENPAQVLVNKFDRAQARAERLSNRLEAQRNRLQTSRQAMNRLGLTATNMARDHDRLGRSVEQLTTRYKRLGAAIRAQQANQNRRSELRGQLLDAVVIGATVAAPLKTAIDFEQSIVKLGAISRTDGEVLGGLSTEAQRLGRAKQFSASESAEAMQFLAMAGFDSDKILKSTEGVLDLAQASGSSLGRTADISSNVLSGFSLGAEEMTRVGNALVGTFTTSNTTLESLGETMKFVAPVASSVGAEMEEVAAMAGILGDVGIQGSMAGTALRSAFLRLTAPPRMAANALADLGIETKTAEGELRKLPDLIEEIAEKTRDMGSGDRSEFVTRIFGKDAASGIAALIAESEKFDRDKSGGRNNLRFRIDKLVEQEIEAAEVAHKMGQTTAGSLRRMGSAFESVAITLGSVLLPTVAATAEGLAVVASWVSSTAQQFPFLTKVIVGVTVGLAALKVTAIAGGFAFTFLKGGYLSAVVGLRTLQAGIALAQVDITRFSLVSTLAAVKMKIVTAAQWAWNVAMSANPISLIVIGIGSLITAGVLLVAHFETVKEFFSGLWSGIVDGIKSAVSWLRIFNDEDEQAKPGDVISAKANTPKVGGAVSSASDSTSDLTTATLPNHTLATNSIQNTQTVNVNAPIQIQAAPGMDANEVAQLVGAEIDNRITQEALSRRSNLFDNPES